MFRKDSRNNHSWKRLMTKQISSFLFSAIYFVKLVSLCFQGLRSNRGRKSVCWTGQRGTLSLWKLLSARHFRFLFPISQAYVGTTRLHVHKIKPSYDSFESIQLMIQAVFHELNACNSWLKMFIKEIIRFNSWFRLKTFNSESILNGITLTMCKKLFCFFALNELFKAGSITSTVSCITKGHHAFNFWINDLSRKMNQLNSWLNRF